MKFNRPTKGNNAETAVSTKNEELVQNVDEQVKAPAPASKKLVGFEQAGGLLKGHNFKDTINEVKNYDVFSNRRVMSDTLNFPICSINFLSLRFSEEDILAMLKVYLGADGGILDKVELVTEKENSFLVAYLDRRKVVNLAPVVKTALDACKVGQEFKINKSAVPTKLLALLEANELSQYEGEIVLQLSASKVVENVIVPSIVTKTTELPVLLEMLGLSNVKVKDNTLYFALRAKGASGSFDEVRISTKQFVTADLMVPYEKFIPMVPSIFNHLYTVAKDEDGKPSSKILLSGQQLRHPKPTCKYVDILKIMGADVLDSQIRRVMTGVSEAPVAKAPILKLDKSYSQVAKVTGNPMLDSLYQKGNTETKFDTNEIMKDFGFLLDGEIHTYKIGSEYYLLVDSKKLFIAVMFPEFYGYIKNNFKFKITVCPDAGYGIGVTMSI